MYKVEFITLVNDLSQAPSFWLVLRWSMTHFNELINAEFDVDSLIINRTPSNPSFFDYFFLTLAISTKLDSQINATSTLFTIMGLQQFQVTEESTPTDIKSCLLLVNPLRC